MTRSSQAYLSTALKESGLGEAAITNITDISQNPTALRTCLERMLGEEHADDCLFFEEEIEVDNCLRRESFKSEKAVLGLSDTDFLSCGVARKPGAERKSVHLNLDPNRQHMHVYVRGSYTKGYGLSVSHEGLYIQYGLISREKWSGNFGSIIITTQTKPHIYRLERTKP